MGLLHYREYSDGTSLVQHRLPQRLRLDLRHRYPLTCDGITIFDLLQTTFPRCSDTARRALCGALPVLATWDTQSFVDSSRVEVTVAFMLGLPLSLRTSSLDGLGQLASVVLDRCVVRICTIHTV